MLIRQHHLLLYFSLVGGEFKLALARLNYGNNNFGTVAESSIGASPELLSFLPLHCACSVTEPIYPKHYK
jgi:hypothetical protein